MIPKILTIAGSDPSGGAGIQADLKTFSALGCYGMSVITALTAQNTKGVDGVFPVDPSFVTLQLNSIFNDIKVDAIKTGMIGDVETVRALVSFLEKYKGPVVVDPVMVTQSGGRLVDDATINFLRENLFPLASLITPNIPEAEVLLGKAINDPPAAARELLKTGADAVLLKGGHGEGEFSVDLLATGDDLEIFEAPRLHTKNTHGTGCTLSAAIACYLGRGIPLKEAVGEAKSYITAALAKADELNVGAGAGPVHHFHGLWKNR